MKPQHASSTTTHVLATLILAGLLLLAVSLSIPQSGSWTYLREFLKELGIVILAVFTVSLLYEVTVAKKYISRFIFLLREQIEQGESNAAACAKMGIIEIFPSRDIFERSYPVRDWMDLMHQDATLRVVAKSLFLMMGKPEVFRTAVQRGARVDLCVFDPAGDPLEAAKAFELEVSDIHSTIAVFRKEIAAWLAETKPPGVLELRFHLNPINDSCLIMRSSSKSYCVWDVSFGRDVTRKRIFLLDPDKSFGGDICDRYGRIWKESRTVFRYEQGVIQKDELAGSSQNSYQ